MTAPVFVHLRLHSEYSVVDGIVRIDDAVAGRRRRRHAGAGAHRSRQRVRHGQVLQGRARAQASSRSSAATCWITNEAERDKPLRAAAAVRVARGLPAPVRLLSRAYRSNQHRGRAEIAREWLAEGTDGLIALSGARDGRRRPGAARRATAQRAERLARAMGGAVSRALLPRGAARRARRRRRAGRRARSRSRRELRLPVVATHPVQFLAPRRFQRARGARVHRRGPRARRPAPAAALHARAVLQDAGRDGASCFADYAAGARPTRVEIAQRCNLRSRSARTTCPRSRRPTGVTLDEYLRERGRSAGLERRLAQLYPDAAQRASAARRYRERLEFEIRTIVQMGFAGYFLIVADFINWAKQQRRAGRARARLGRGLAGRLLARHHRPRSAALRPAVRALPQSRARVDARLRHRLLPGRPRPRDRLRASRSTARDRVSQIATFGTHGGASAVVRDVGRVLDLPLQLLRPASPS